MVEDLAGGSRGGGVKEEEGVGGGVEGWRGGGGGWGEVGGWGMCGSLIWGRWGGG